MLIDLSRDDPELLNVEEQMQTTIRDHKGNFGGIFHRYNIIKVGRAARDSCRFSKMEIMDLHLRKNLKE